MRVFTILIGCLSVGPCLGQDQLVLTRLYQDGIIEKDAALHLDLEDFFQFYEEPGPVATFVIDMPELDSRELLIAAAPGDSDNTSIVTYKLKNGKIYNDPYSVGGTDYVWNRQLIEFRLLAGQTPVTVANFMTYVTAGVYENTIIHRNEATGTVFRPQDYGGGFAGHIFIPFPIIQAGGFRLYDDEQYVLEAIDTAAPIPFEAVSELAQGTLAMARSATLDSATSQFFLNLQDNSYIVADPYTVFGELVDPVTDMPILLDFANAPVYDLTTPYAEGEANLFPHLPFQSIPLYAPYPFEKDSYARITSITIPEGNPEGITYSYEWVIEGEEPTEDELDNQSVFDVEINGASLRISRHNTGHAVIRVIGSGMDGEHSEFEIRLTAYNQKALDIFKSSDIHFDGWIENDWYGWLIADTYPEMYHLNHGNQIIGEKSTADFLFLFDLGLTSWVYTNPTMYPFIYSYRLSTWLWYQLGSGDYDSPRWFYIYDTDDPRWVKEDEL